MYRPACMQQHILQVSYHINISRNSLCSCPKAELLISRIIMSNIKIVSALDVLINISFNALINFRLHVSNRKNVRVELTVYFN